MLSLTICIIYLPSVLLSAVLAQAPGDGDPFCTSTLPTVGSVPLPPSPPNAKIILDSYSYINLLPPHGGPVWQEVDVDAMGGGTHISVSYSIHYYIIYYYSYISSCSGVRTPTLHV